MAGQDDFTPGEWETMRRAVVAAGVLVAWADGGRADDIGKEMFALHQRLRGATASHPSQLIRELADVRGGFQTNFDLDQKVGANEGPRLEAIRTAARTVAAKTSKEETRAFREFVVEVATVVASANTEGWGNKNPISRNEAAAIERVKEAVGLR